MMPLQFDIKPLFKHVIEPRKIGQAAIVLYAVVQKTVGTAGKTKQTGGMIFDIFSRRKMLAFFMCEV